MMVIGSVHPLRWRDRRGVATPEDISKGPKSLWWCGGKNASNAPGWLSWSPGAMGPPPMGVVPWKVQLIPFRFVGWSAKQFSDPLIESDWLLIGSFRGIPWRLPPFSGTKGDMSSRNITMKDSKRCSFMWIHKYYNILRNHKIIIFSPNIGVPSYGLKSYDMVKSSTSRGRDGVEEPKHHEI